MKKQVIFIILASYMHAFTWLIFAGLVMHICNLVNTIAIWKKVNCVGGVNETINQGRRNRGGHRGQGPPI